MPAGESPAQAWRINPAVREGPAKDLAKENRL
jgi:hypothetical protein